jgi:hypothetical protein
VPYNWVSLVGDFDSLPDGLRYRGALPTQQITTGQPVPNVGNFVCDQAFQGGTISGEVKFIESTLEQGCEFILHYEPSTQTFLTAGFNPYIFCVVRSFSNLSVQAARVFGSAGPTAQLQPDRTYRLSVRVAGSEIAVAIDGVNTVVINLPFTLPRGQSGIWCAGAHDIEITNFLIDPVRPKVFVIMQFSPPYNELYTEVIQPVCESFGFEVVRADEIYGPGLIISDIEQNLVQANIIIADVTPVNANVYYELGYAHALRKETILVAERETKLPFDISPFRTLFYENSIAGKTRVEHGLRNHLRAIQQRWAV